MTLDEAQQIAHLVEASEDWIVTAIGRFVLLDELQQGCERGFIDNLPWMVAIMAVGDVKTLTKLTCVKDWEDLQRRQIIPGTTQKPTQSRQIIPETTQGIPSGMLF